MRVRYGIRSVLPSIKVEFSHFRATVVRSSQLERNLRSRGIFPPFFHLPTNTILILQLEVLSGTVDTVPLLVTPGSPSADINFTVNTANHLYNTWNGSTLISEEVDSPLSTVAFVISKIPSKASFSSSKTLYFIGAFTSSLEASNKSPLDRAIHQWTEKVSISEDLFPTHIQEWETIWNTRIEVSGNLELAQAINSSIYCMIILNFKFLRYLRES